MNDLTERLAKLQVVTHDRNADDDGHQKGASRRRNKKKRRNAGNKNYHYSEEEQEEGYQLCGVRTSSKVNFVEFFQKGSAGWTIFADFIVPFLNLDDINKGSNVCRLMNAMCRSYTVGEILATHHMENLSRDHKLQLGKFIIGSVRDSTTKYNPDHRRHVRLVRTSTEVFRARLYHPAQMDEILLAMTVYFHQHRIHFASGVEEYNWEKANSDSETPVLISAHFGVAQKYTDVTVIIRYLLMKQGNQRLRLRRPVNGPQYWYIYLFGDLAYQVRKFLKIKYRMDG